ncbi:MAG TPA: guanitoxin biosynthesis heme-dependent pre-guanitoxin N-hydroxylase GntA [Chthoniobacterales bacterium]|nr:guanitoxin biosynthesis heme-dependent pre-guanitoxin N-hydroxylase GntA [Chthoniobacterales bacterium]
MRPNPFASDLAVANSCLHFASNGELVGRDADSFLHEAHREFRRRIGRAEFPCVGAKAALHEQTYGFAAYSKLASVESTAGLCRDLFEFRERARKIDNYATLIAVFARPLNLSETYFEDLLWRQLRQLHAADVASWAANVSSDPADSHFSFSFAGRAFYVVGMHAASSRAARRFPWPTLVFNPHEQFERLRADGKWKRMQQTIRAREMALQGSINPMLNDFGERSEARQYSGRAVSDDWVAPFPTRAKCPLAH